MRGRPALRSAAIGAALLAMLGGCVTWHHLPRETLRTSHRLRERLQVWVHGREYTLHGVRPVNDSVAGVPVHLPPTCDSCAVRFAVADVDSVRSLDESMTLARNLAWAVPVGLCIAFFVALGRGLAAGAGAAGL